VLVVAVYLPVTHLVFLETEEDAVVVVEPPCNCVVCGGGEKKNMLWSSQKLKFRSDSAWKIMNPEESIFAL
jgi:hypothetical protein